MTVVLSPSLLVLVILYGVSVSDHFISMRQSTRSQFEVTPSSFHTSGAIVFLKKLNPATQFRHTAKRKPYTTIVAIRPVRN